jgi:5-methylcytosine-specific restriction endonuclease McrA
MNKRKKQDNVLYARTRKWAYERDEGLCVLCGAMATEVHLIEFRSHGGLSNLNNLACLCRDCHTKAHGVDAKRIREILKERNEVVVWQKDE